MNKLKLTLALATCVSVAAFITACDKKVGKLPQTVAPPPPPGACDTITYNKHIKPIIDNNCVSCHNIRNQSGGVMLESYTDVKNKAEAGRIKARVIDGDGGFMPQTGELSPDLKNLISCWLGNGMKEN